MKHTQTSAAFFYGTRGTYPRIRSLVQLIVERKLPIRLVNTGQHWDPTFIGKGFGLIKPVNLQTHTADSSIISLATKNFLIHNPCNFIVVYGDTASTLGPALAAQELGLPIVHFESGFRTYDSHGKRVQSDLPEEAIRTFVDGIADVNVPLIRSAYTELTTDKQQGLARGSIAEPVGHPLADQIIIQADKYDHTKPDVRCGLLTIHRQANVQGDAESGIAHILKQLAIGRSKSIQWLFPAHPGVRRLIESSRLKIPSNIQICNPLSHKDMLAAVTRAGIVVTDSNGLQVEASLIGRRLVIPRAEVCYIDLLDSCILTAPNAVSQAVDEALSIKLPIKNLSKLRNKFSNGQSSRNMFDILHKLIKRYANGQRLEP